MVAWMLLLATAAGLTQPSDEFPWVLPKGFSNTPDSGRQPDVRFQAGAGPVSLLRHVAVSQWHAVVRQLSSAGARVYGRPFYIIPKQGPGPLAPTRGQVIDHMGLSVADLPATAARLKREGVKFLEEPHAWGTTQAAMIEGPDSVAIELVEVK
jgi:hypothetical protein